MVLLATRAAAAEERDQFSAIRSAEQAERELRFADAVTEFRRAVEQAPSSRLARRATGRLEYLEARREGDFGPLTKLEQTRRVSRPTADQIRAFEHEIESFPPGRVRRESRALVAEAYLARLELFPNALRAHEAWLAEPGLDDAEWLRATNGLALSRARLGDVSGSLETLRAHGLSASAEASYLELALVRRVARPLGYLVVLAFILVALGTAPKRSLSHLFTPAHAVAAFWLLGIPLLLAYYHRPETWRTFVYLAPMQGLILLVATIAGGKRSRGSALAVGSLGVLAQIAVAYLTLDASGALLGWLITRRIA